MDQQVNNPQELKQYFRHRLPAAKKASLRIQGAPIRKIKEGNTLSPKQRILEALSNRKQLINFHTS